MKITTRLAFLLTFLFCLAALSVAAYFQFVEELEPCPLCISQRIFILAVGLISLLAAIHHPARTGEKIYAGLAAAFAFGGMMISGRHVWIQNLPADQVPSCGPGLSYIFKNFPLSKTIEAMLSGTGECADVLWTFLGLSIPAWTFLAFAALTIWNILILSRQFVVADATVLPDSEKYYQ
ncbi:MAG TPA: disulfide bond formation protein B [Crenotrichaceae bacterium]|nr:disulfide bond formation protein B [Crenotrichaceae bacterium]